MAIDSEPHQGNDLPDVLADTGHDAGVEIDNIVPTYGYQLTPMVGLGGSAGAFRALRQFFEAMPPDSGMVFVVVLHLSPLHESKLPAMIGRWTAMPTMQAQDGQPALANHVYVIPPGKHLIAVGGHLRLKDLSHQRGRRVAVDLFFRSLADTHGPHAAAVVLSGADSDGMMGIKRIKERGGLTISQDPEESEHDSMPRAAISSGMVDWVLEAAEMPARILDYIRRESKLDVPIEDGPPPASSPAAQGSQVESAFREILVFLRTQTGHDFSHYKRATVLRRIARRMQVNGVDAMPEYLAFLRTHPGEAGALLKDMLVSVTNFFRDREAFAALESHLPSLFAGKGPSDTVRVWCPACATGEEAYSLAIMLLEHARALERPPGLQVFGCDLAEDAIQAARTGAYPDTIAADVSDARLHRFFVREHRGYRVRRELREVVLFATHDLIKDAPFSRLDLVSCRNLLIYLDRDAQERALDILHFALRPDGLLFLGSSETVGDGNARFRTVDSRFRIYAKNVTQRVGVPVPLGPGILFARELEQNAALRHGREPAHRVAIPAASLSPSAALASRIAPSNEEDRISWSELHFKLIERFGPPSVLVNREHEIQHISESAGRFLQMAGGEPTTHLPRLVHSALRPELRALLIRATSTSSSAEAFGIPLELEGAQRNVDITVHPATDVAPGHMLVTFALHRGAGDTTQEPRAATPAEPMARHVEYELARTKDDLRETVEQYEASTEELKASNEELQAMNEELRSATEELETSREELQSINEELTTVNHEARSKLDELAQANSDLQNLMSATAIATVFLDRDLRVMRYTEPAAPIFHLIASDVGRPLAHLQHEIDYPELTQDAANVLGKLQPVEREVTGPGGTSYLSRMLPYRTHDDRIAGVVLTFVDITERDRARRELAEDLAATERLRAISEQMASEENMQTLFDAMVDAAIAITHADAGTVQLLDTDEGVLRLLASRGLPQELTDRFKEIDAGTGTPCEVALASGKRSFADFEQGTPETAESYRLHREAGGLRVAQSTPLMTRDGRPIGAITTHYRRRHEATERELRFLDILARQAADAIERQIAAEVLREQMEELQRFNDAAVGRETRMIELKREVNDLAVRLGGVPRYSLDFERDAD